MLTIQLAEEETFDSNSEEFVTLPAVTVKLEHSLVSLSKWESIHEKPFLSGDEKTEAEIASYVECMILAPEDSSDLIGRFTPGEISQINSYIEAKMTATWFSDEKKRPAREAITAEVIYYWMISFQIPFECQHWHLNRLLTLIKVCNAKNKQPKKMSKAEIANRNRLLNKQRKEQLNTSG